MFANRTRPLSLGDNTRQFDRVGYNDLRCDNLAEGLAPDEIVAEYPPLAIEDIHAALAYAATLAREEELVPIR